MKEEINKDRYRNRRRMAWLSFACIFFVGVGLLLYGLFSEENAQRVEDLSFLVGSLLGVWTTVVAAYYGVTTINDREEIRISSRGSYEQSNTRMVKEAPPHPYT